jgi:hypothetical protein
MAARVHDSRQLVIGLTRACRVTLRVTCLFPVLVLLDGAATASLDQITWARADSRLARGGWVTGYRGRRGTRVRNRRCQRRPLAMSRRKNPRPCNGRLPAGSSAGALAGVRRIIRRSEVSALPACMLMRQSACSLARTRLARDVRETRGPVLSPIRTVHIADTLERILCVHDVASFGVSARRGLVLWSHVLDVRSRDCAFVAALLTFEALDRSSVMDMSTTQSCPNR